ncbi:hypothetical protein FOQG_10480 [Fusarium oxysporum f. sp. raphani 54005]|uniref:Uncharacterized protein n=6 Tax=Fusarium oxysporum TaxID=5507 RepID=X0C4I8_FUSOX|nr:hypothetical protein FOXB_08001 [Fusarium oxysporum f. sp. conglutinans Fo5176]EXA34500.1 hypothetical protein FOVG_14479 [Fusarium oxysporum f. sp. pisi HDV247]EXK24702.1 hypothetical protein FOMG_18598 [Fusarium oxysporum f. sp. melonis 26406]EXK85689.1 hypothetical protein FOQG_10480 [Fusarium oxysporum f. sp. raphani 54005]EXL78356.1 hypothetical protein FOPG_07525 [Fusarium oxysporum f. sp. conglutinans race 2 54008]EXM19510.1 hypothetical protein FOTG_12558 [Fusarium oxysporum f. sp. 
MPCTTALSHYVRESILKEWLALTFGGAETGSWSCEEIAHGENGYWQVTAPREITAGEQTQLELKSRPARVRTFGT